MKYKFRIIPFFVIFLCISSCGFKPSLAKESEGYRLLDDISLSKVEGKDHLKLERFFSDYFIPSPHALPLYTLNLKINSSVASMGILKDSQSTRYRVRVDLDYSLFDAETKKKITQGNLYLYTGYDVEESEFINYTSERVIVDNLLKELAEELRHRLISVLITRKTSENTR